MKVLSGVVGVTWKRERRLALNRGKYYRSAKQFGVRYANRPIPYNVWLKNEGSKWFLVSVLKKYLFSSLSKSHFCNPHLMFLSKNSCIGPKAGKAGLLGGKHEVI